MIEEIVPGCSGKATEPVDEPGTGRATPLGGAPGAATGSTGRLQDDERAGHRPSANSPTPTTPAEGRWCVHRAGG